MGRRIGFFLFPDFQLLDLSGPLATFQIAGRFSSENAYEVVYLSKTGGRIVSSAGLDVDTKSLVDTPLHTLMIVGGWGVRAACLDETTCALVSQWGQDAVRVTSVCSGAFLLAAIGWLDGRKATTHWRSATEMMSRFPKVRLVPDRIFVQDDRFWTSAGITAGIDLALALIEQDLGKDVARAVARELVVPQRRAGGQSQFSTLQDLEPESDRMRHVVQYIREHLSENLSVEHLASVACLSPRQFTRRFTQEIGTTPAQTVDRLRAETARVAVANSDQTVDALAQIFGYRDSERMRRSFVRWFGLPPQSIRRQSRI